MEVSPLSLRETLGPVSFVSAGDVIASRFCCDSRAIQPGDAFVAMSGSGQDGHQFVDSAIAAGAAAVVLERPHPRINVPQCIVPDTRAAFGKVCMALHGQPQKSLVLAGVTGTNGKTTSTWLLRAILQAAGKATGLLGTIEYACGKSRSAALLTTPGAIELAQLLASMVRESTSHCVMEISSHALDQRRCAAVPLSAAAITNITQDHFDYHGGMDQYVTAKSRIATLLKPGAPLLIGIDDPGCRAALDIIPSETNTLTFGFDASARLRAEVMQRTDERQVVRLMLSSATVEVESHLVGRHNALNLLTAAALAEQIGIHPDAIEQGLSKVSHVPGRMERVVAGQPFSVIVDYAHTPDGLAHCVSTARALSRGRVILVFGAGGNRDRQKRPLMARSAEAADLVIVTSDNPRYEMPHQIIAEICSGFGTTEHVQTCVDRQDAIVLAIRSALPGDVVVIAGRGHESTQQIGDRHISFDDRKVARRFLRELLSEMRPALSRVPDAIPA